jgi:hypothetical protein
VPELVFTGSFKKGINEIEIGKSPIPSLQAFNRVATGFPASRTPISGHSLAVQPLDFVACRPASGGIMLVIGGEYIANKIEGMPSSWKEVVNERTFLGL